jgi:hypothetical protein
MKTLFIFIDQNVSKKVLWAADSIFLFLTFYEGLEFWTRIVAAAATLFLSVAGGINYLSKRRVNKIEEQIKQQQLYDIIESNKKKYMDEGKKEKNTGGESGGG